MLRDELTYYVDVGPTQRRHARAAPGKRVEIYNGDDMIWEPADTEQEERGAAAAFSDWVKVSKAEFVAGIAPTWFPELVWLTQAQAADVLGCHISWVRKLVAAGQVLPRGVARRLPSLARADVVTLAGRRGADARQARLAAVRDPAAVRSTRQPPDAVHDWLSVAQAAELLGVSTVAVGARCRRGRLPHTWHGGQRWIQRTHLEVDQRARAFAKAHSVVEALAHPDPGTTTSNLHR